MLKKYLKVILFIAFFLMVDYIIAQGRGWHGRPDAPGPPPPPGLPIDGGIFGLLAVALAYGVKKINDKFKK